METAPAWAADAFAAACNAIEVPVEAGEFLRVGTYATWLVPDFGLVARVASADEQALVAREYTVAEALDGAGVPVAMPARPLFTHATGTVGWWELGTPTVASYYALGTVARQLHDRTARWLTTGGRCTVYCDLVGQANRRFEYAYTLLPNLHSELDAARKLLHEAAADVATKRNVARVIAHGDLSPHNVLADGRLIDLETSGLGEPAIDLARIAGAVERYGAPITALREFANGYGCDVREFAGGRVQTWMRIRDLWAAAWAAACADRSTEIADEARLRLTTLTDPSVTWSLI